MNLEFGICEFLILPRQLKKKEKAWDKLRSSLNLSNMLKMLKNHSEI